MGEARQKGLHLAHVAASQQRVLSLPQRQPAMTCNACGQKLTDLRPVDTGALRGIACAFQAHCTACDQDTWAVRGDPAAVRAFYTALEKATGQRVQLGRAKPGLVDQGDTTPLAD